MLLQADLARQWLAQRLVGLRPWALQNPAQVALWQPGHPRHTQDLDTLEDLARLARDTGQTWVLPSTGAKTGQN